MKRKLTSSVALILAVACLAVGAVKSAKAQAPAVSILTETRLQAALSGAITTGTAALVSGSCTVAAPMVTGSSKIFFTPLTADIALPIYPAARVSGTNFTAVSGTASGAFSYLILNR